jgi:HK97 family phage major capsid protein
MSDLARSIITQRARAWEAAKALLDTADAENRSLSAEESQTWDRMNAEITALDQRAADLIESEKRAADLAAALGPVTSRTVEPKGADLRSFLRGDGGRAFEVRATQRDWSHRDLVKGTATAGGNTVQTSFYDRLIDHLIEVSAILTAGATVIQTGSGESIQVPVTTAHSAASIISEGSPITESDPAFAQRTLGAYKYGIVVQLSNELISDTSVDLEGYLAMQLGRALGNGFGSHAITGTGTGQPTGIVTSATTGVTGGAGVAGAFTADNLIDLYHSVIDVYRRSSAAGWLMRDTTLGAARKLKDAAGNYIWQPSLAISEPSSILGKPVFTDPGVAAVGLGAKSVVFGDISRYLVRLAGDVRIERSAEFAFNADLVTVRGILRADGVLADQTGAVKVFTGNAA